MGPYVLVNRLLEMNLSLPVAMGSRKAEHEARLQSMFEAHFNTVWRTLRRLGVPEPGADDGAQQVFLVASRRLDEIEEGGERRYLLGVALRVASEIRRAMRRRREIAMDASMLEVLDAETVKQHPDEALANKRALLMLADCLQKMPEKLREAFVLFELDELSAPEVAQLLRVPIGTVASRVRLAREHIREHLGPRGAL
jgi:RNA polymerase sigma-70 factor, ECF subfamily